MLPVGPSHQPLHLHTPPHPPTPAAPHLLQHLLGGQPPLAQLLNLLAQLAQRRLVLGAQRGLRLGARRLRLLAQLAVDHQ